MLNPCWPRDRQEPFDPSLDVQIPTWELIHPLQLLLIHCPAPGSERRDQQQMGRKFAIWSNQLLTAPCTTPNPPPGWDESLPWDEPFPFFRKSGKQHRADVEPAGAGGGDQKPPFHPSRTGWALSQLPGVPWGCCHPLSQSSVSRCQ